MTKTKEQLEHFLSESNNVIKTNDKINKGLNIIEKDENKSMIKILAYISKISKNQKEMKKLFNELIKNKNISFIKENNTVKYEEYIFNGIPIPKNIEVKDIGKNHFKLFWKIDDAQIKNNKNNIKYIVEIKKKDSEEKFSKVYEGNDTNCVIEKLKENTNYEIRVCCKYDNIYGKYGDIINAKTILDSIILNSTEKGESFLNIILEWIGYKKLELLYRGTRDGSNCSNFHKTCDNQGPTVCLYQNEKGHIFGGFSSASWSSDQNNYCNSPNSFLFTLTNIHKIQPTKFPCIYEKEGIYNYKDYGTLFGSNDIYIRKDFMKEKSCTSFPKEYQDILGKGKSIFTGDLNNNNENFTVKEIEIFKPIK